MNPNKKCRRVGCGPGLPCPLLNIDHELRETDRFCNDLGGDPKYGDLAKRRIRDEAALYDCPYFRGAEEQT